ncbi:MAG: ABC transporter substrate-binding protein, partial [Candidatus Methylomirabilales bacterium]
VGAAAAEGAVLTCPCADPNTSQDAEAKAFGAAYKEKFGEEPTIYAGEGYDAATILIEAIRKAGKPAAGVRAYREAVTGNVAATSGLKGVTKAYRFQASGELVSEAVEIYLYRVKGGKYVLEGTAADLLK